MPGKKKSGLIIARSHSFRGWQAPIRQVTKYKMLIKFLLFIIYIKMYKTLSKPCPFLIKYLKS